MKTLAVVLSLVLCVSNALAVKPRQVRINHLDIATHPDLVVDSPRPHFSWQLESVDSVRSLTQLAYQYQVVPQSKRDDYFFDSGKIVSAQPTTLVVLDEGAELSPDSAYVFRVRYWSSNNEVSQWSEAPFRTALFHLWRAMSAQWIGHLDMIFNEIRLPFTVDSTKTVDTAVAYISGLGYYHLFVNGQNVDPSRRLDPGWTTFETRALYTTFNVSTLLTPGANAIGVWLGGGWYSQEQYIIGVDEPAYGPPRLLFQLNIRFTDGTTSAIVSDDKSGWLGRTGALLHDGVYMGTVYDARFERATFATAGFVDNSSLWLPAQIVPSPLNSKGVLSLQIHDPIRLPPDNLHIATSAGNIPGAIGQPVNVHGGNLITSNGGIITPVSISSFEGQLFDLGQNIAGWCVIKAKGRRGQSIHIRYSETLALPNNPQVFNSQYRENLSQAAATDIYIFRTDNQIETIEPRFTTHGFRYILIVGYKNGGGLDASAIQCQFVHSETTLKGNFTTSNLVINQIQHNIQWGQLSNLMSLPTDCCNRAERKGWMGDAALTVDEALFNFDLAPFYYNFLTLIRDDQAPNGGVSDTVPHTFGVNPADPNWSTAYPTISYALYDHYGDTAILAEHFETIMAMVEQLRGDYNKTGLKGLRYEYGDWVQPPPYQKTNQNLVASFPFLRDVMTLSKIAALLNQVTIARRYEAFYSSLCLEFHSTFYTSDLIGYADGQQTANALALALPGLVPANKIPFVVAALVNDVTSKGTLTTGIVGVAQLFPVLSTNGHHDLALTLAQSTKYPSHGYMAFNEVENATTLWELWDSPNEGPGMNSRNHIMFGSIGAWFYRYVAGINPNALNNIKIRPRMAKDTSLSPEVHAEVHTIKGMITVDYVRDATAQSIHLKVTVPANSQATLSLEPLSKSGECLSVHEGDSLIYSMGSGMMYSPQMIDKIEQVKGVRSVSRDAEDGAIHVHLDSGSFEFRAVWA